METTTTLMEVNTDIKIVKVERYDADVMDQLLCDTRFSKKDLGNLGRYKRCRKGANEHEVIYHYGRGCEAAQLGRLYPHGNQGLQDFPFDIRNPLLEKYYWDCDMANCHYNILAKLGEDWGVRTTAVRQYIANRDAELSKVSSSKSVAKTAFLKVAYGGDIKLYNDHYSDDGIAPNGDVTLLKAIQQEIKAIVDLCWSRYECHRKIVAKKSNPKFSLFALILQTEERKCLLAMDTFMKTQGRRVDVLIHDGGEIYKLENEREFPPALLRGAEAFIKQATGYSHQLVIKPFVHNFTKQVEFLLGPEIVVDAVYAAREFARLMGDLLVYDSGVIWVFDESTGIWGFDEQLLARVVTNMDARLHFKQMGALGVNTFNYSGNVKSTSDLITKLPHVITRRDGFFQTRISSDVGKLLFTDGIYEFKSRTFTKGFDPEVVFRYACPRAYPSVRDEVKVAYIKNKSFKEPFSNPEFARVLVHNLMRATIGDFKRKKMVVGIGFTNSGKGMTTQLVQTAFGRLVGTFNGNSLLTRRDGGESARELAWIQDLAYTRFSFSSEIRVDLDEKKSPTIDGNLLKGIVSGGDVIKTRKPYGQEVAVINKSTTFIFANDMPLIAPPSEVMERIQVTHWGYSYVNEPTLPYERKCDMEMGELYAQESYGDAFFHVMCDEYEGWRESGFVEPVLPECSKAGRSEMVNAVKVTDLMEHYEITGSPFHSIPFDEVYQYFKDAGVTETKNKVGRILTELGIGKGSRRLNGVVTILRTGLRVRAEEE
jgi:hypothetical protein